MIAKEDLARMYWQEKKHCRLIAEELGVTPDAVIYQFKKFGIKRRTKSEARKLLYEQGFVSVTSLRRGENAISWKSGKLINHEGYVRVILKPEDSFFKPMCHKDKNSDSYSVFEHRLVMAKHLNRCLSIIEKVHHLNGNRQDNRPENLELISPANHSLQTFFCYHCPLKKQNRLLQQELQRLRQGNFHH